MRPITDEISSSVKISPATTHESTEYRKALSCFATGVTVVTAYWQGMDWGMTCNSFASVSLEPRLVLWSIRKAANSLEAFIESGGFTVSVLSQPQIALAKQFATGDMPSRFSGVPAERMDSKRLKLKESLAWFDCSMHQVVDAGDHLVLIGLVNHFGWRDANTLGFWRSQFDQFEELSA